MSLHPVSAAEAAARLPEFDALIDARSPAEFAADHLPGAVNWPVLDDEERRVVGTLYTQVSALQARKVGAAMVARNIATHLDRWAAPLPREWRPLVYCWRGGQRSGSLAWFLGQIGFRTVQLQGGYKGFRAVVRAGLDALPATLCFTVLTGRTGSGKTRLLQALAAQGAQVLDLEGLACHRGSILGAWPGTAQPTQKRFDTLIWDALRLADPSRPLFVESESARIGALAVPEALLLRMRQHGRVVQVEMADAARVALLLQDYAHFAAAPEAFCKLLDGLIELRGRATVASWQAQARAGQWAQVFGSLMAQHYDPLYMRSLQRSYADLVGAPAVSVGDGGTAAMAAAAATLLTLSAGN
ncbi:MAG: tRNA 2-selenouridine(34) synthase MnmH [Chitinophagaceae bacterium]|nr:tRNA 2-selenouridine(34) synthase MnmH [Rubrivivax sp.]